jgi:hypothetical protein
VDRTQNPLGVFVPQEIKAVAVTAYRVAADGTSVSMNFVDAEGNPTALSLPSSYISELLLSLPALARQAHRAQFNDDSLKIVFPLGRWMLQLAESGAMMLTLMTVEGFEITFGMTGGQLGELGETLIDCERGFAGAVN